MEEQYLIKKFQENKEKCVKEFETLPLHLKEEVDKLQSKNYFSDFYDNKNNPQAMFFISSFLR